MPTQTAAEENLDSENRGSANRTAMSVQVGAVVLSKLVTAAVTMAVAVAVVTMTAAAAVVVASAWTAADPAREEAAAASSSVSDGDSHQRGTLPCLRRGSSSRLDASMRNPATSFWRVSAGSITSSM